MQAINNLYNSFYNHCSPVVQDYLDEVPRNTGEQMIYAAGAACIVEIIVEGRPSQGLIVGALSALTTAIYGLVTPLFKDLVGQNRTQLTWGEEMCRTFTAIIGAGCITAVCGNSTILKNLVGRACLYGVVNYMNPTRGNLNSTSMICIFPDFSQPHSSI